MKIVVTLLCGNNQAIVGDAIQSVLNWVDELLLIDTGIKDQSIEIAQKLAGDKLRVEKFDWCNDFALARNFSLRVATDHGGDWALTLDTDERLVFDRFENITQLKQKLNEVDIALWMVPTVQLHYSKERFIKLPTKFEWQGRTHEALFGSNSAEQSILADCFFWELDKSEEQAKIKYERDLKILLEETELKPNDGRWWYYLGQTYSGLKLYRKAVDAYRECFSINSWNEQAAWACYCGANAHLKLGEFEAALETAAKGLTLCTTFPELAWQAGFCCYKLNRFRDAIAWQHMSISLGHFKGIGAGAHRIGQRHVPAWYESPFDVLRFAYKKMGDRANAEFYEELYNQAKECRLNLLAQAKGSRTDECQ